MPGAAGDTRQGAEVENLFLIFFYGFGLRAPRQPEGPLLTRAS